MKSDSPIAIRMIDVSALVSHDFAHIPPFENEYQVYWWKDLPLGHRWSRLRDHAGQTSHTIAPLIWAAIHPTLQFYCDQQQSMSFEQLQQHWRMGRWSSFSHAMDRLAKTTDFAQGHAAEVSLVICTRNRTAALRHCLDSLSGLTVQPGEVLVVDNAPDDDQTGALVARYPGVRYILEKKKGLDHARNAGWRAATAPIVAYTDDDVRLHKNWMGQIVAAFDGPQVQAVTGLVLAETLQTESQINFEKYWSFNRGYQDLYYDGRYFKKHLHKGVPAWDIGAGANMAFRRSALQITGGFDGRLDVGAAGCSGDSEMWYRLMAEGWTIHYTPRAIAYHTHRQGKAAFKRQIYSYLRGAAASLLVQYQRTGHRGNLYHLYRTWPLYYLTSAALRLRHPRSKRYNTLLVEVSGYLSGIRYFYTHRHLEEENTCPALDPDDSEQALVSVVITTYNQAPYLPDAIKSVQDQTYGPVELIVVDDGSTDHTRAILSGYPDVKYVYQANRGLAAARNTGIGCCSGAFVVFLDADDLLYPGAIAKNRQHMLQHPDCAFVSGWHDRVDEEKKLLLTPENVMPEEYHYQALLRGNYIGMHAAVMYRRKIFDFFRFDEQLPACEDYDLYLRVAKRYPIFSHNQKIAAYRIHGHNMSANIDLMRKQVQKVLDKNKPVPGSAVALQSYREGKRNWNAYYGSAIYERLASPDRHPAYRVNSPDVLFILMHTPLRLIKLLLYKIRHTGWRLIRSKSTNMKTKIKQLLGYGTHGHRPRTGKIRMGHLRRTTPFSREFGYDRGGPVDRYYIERFLQQNSGCIQGHVLEIGDNAYTRAFGGGRVAKSDILYVDDTNKEATIIGDLSRADHIASNQFDCIILTQTLHLIYDFQAAIRHCHRLLKPEGVLLLTTPGISQIDYGQWGDSWYWSFTGSAISKLLTGCFDPTQTVVQTHGNVLAATAFLYGMGQQEISTKEKDDYDPHYPVIITGKAIKQEHVAAI